MGRIRHQEMVCPESEMPPSISSQATRLRPLGGISSFLPRSTESKGSLADFGERLGAHSEGRLRPVSQDCDSGH